jgi:hypothetical protein
VLATPFPTRLLNAVIMAFVANVLALGMLAIFADFDNMTFRGRDGAPGGDLESVLRLVAAIALTPIPLALLAGIGSRRVGRAVLGAVAIAPAIVSIAYFPLQDDPTRFTVVGMSVVVIAALAAGSWFGWRYPPPATPTETSGD